jgi:hypothetical protein
LTERKVVVNWWHISTAEDHKSLVAAVCRRIHGNPSQR